MKKKNTIKDYALALYEVTKDQKGKELEQTIVEFAGLIVKRGLSKKIDKIINEYVAYAKKQEGIVDIEITSIRKLDSKMVKEIEQAFGEKVESIQKTDESILGGIRIKISDKIFDASLRTQLQRLKQQLI